MRQKVFRSAPTLAQFHVSEHNQLLIAGVDEAGRGPLAGAVFAAAVMLDREQPLSGLDDSKKLSWQQREELYDQIISRSLCYAVASVDAREIDRLNILQASLLAMKRAVDKLVHVPQMVYVDGQHLPVWDYPAQAVIKGDSLLQAIAAASILAKVSRDRDMLEQDRLYPCYGFAKHKGYPTSAHLQALRAYGPCAIHRQSFRPVAECTRQSRLK
ncbi:MAG: ribonuclease HII [Pseudomonadales bacterium]|nr:ribonuclease HII [Pseudomonadales bacterium]